VGFVQNGVFSKHYSPPHKSIGEVIQLLYVGHAKPSKGVDALIVLAAMLKTQSHIHFHLTICLSGFGSQSFIEKLIKVHKLEKNITFKPNIDVIAEMTDADMLILPLRTCVGTSLTPNIIVEAISTGLPIAVPKFDELKGIIEFGVNAVELNLSDMTKSVEAIEHVSNATQLSMISRYQRQQFKTQFTLEHFVKGYTRELNLD